jgi:hypothetical protein
LNKWSKMKKCKLFYISTYYTNTNILKKKQEKLFKERKRKNNSSLTLFRRRYFLGCSSVDITSTFDDSSIDADSDILKREFIWIFHSVS